MLKAERDFDRVIRLWDQTYRARIAKTAAFLVCEAQFPNTSDPPVLHRAKLISIFGRVPSTLNPPEVKCSHLDSLLDVATLGPDQSAPES